MKNIIFSLWIAAVSAAVVERRSVPPLPISLKDAHKLPRVFKALQDLAVFEDDAPNISALFSRSAQSMGTPKLSGPTSFASALQGLLAPSLQPTAPDDIKTKYSMKNAIRKKVRYGPFDVLAANDASHANDAKMAGMNVLFVLNQRMKAFCSDCTLLETTISMVDDDGQHANIANGIYLHHAIIPSMNKLGYTFGAKSCAGSNAKLPSMVALGLADNSSTTFTSPDGTFKGGNYVSPDTKDFLLLLDVNNYANKSRKLWMSLEYEYLEGKQPGFLDTVMQFVNGGSCASGFVPSQPEYSMSSNDFFVKYNGTLINGLGHLHDGGTNVTLTLNGQDVCNSHAHYGTSAEYVGEVEVGGKNTTWAGITSMDLCSILKPIKENDVLKVTAHYDLNKHPLRKNVHGDNEDVMALVMAQLGVQV